MKLALRQRSVSSYRSGWFLVSYLRRFQGTSESLAMGLVGQAAPSSICAAIMLMFQTSCASIMASYKLLPSLLSSGEAKAAFQVNGESTTSRLSMTRVSIFHLAGSSSEPSIYTKCSSLTPRCT